MLTLANGPDGATGTLVSVDQNNFEMPVSRITEEGSRVKLAITMVSGGFEGEITGNEIPGTWTQGPLSLPGVQASAVTGNDRRGVAGDAPVE